MSGIALYNAPFRHAQKMCTTTLMSSYYTDAVLISLKRFVAQCNINGQPHTVHLPNSGSMRTLNTAGSTVWLKQHAPSSTRKTNYSLEVVVTDNGTPVGVHSAYANTLVEQALQQQMFATLASYTQHTREVRFAGTNSRFDFYLTGGAQSAYAEVKSVQMMRQSGLAQFPDSVTARGLKHLAHLMDAKAQGYHSVLIFCAQRADAQAVGIAADIDPAYAAAIAHAQQAGVEILALRCKVTPQGITPLSIIPFVGSQS